MENEILMEKLKTLTMKETSLSFICNELEINKFEVLNLINELRKYGICILTKKHDDDLYLLNIGEKERNINNNISFKTNEEHEFKFVAISDTRIGSKSQQLSILNDIYQKAENLGIDTVIHCGNITEGLYSPKDDYSESIFLDDSQTQIDYINKFYPRIDGIKTYFITGKG